MHLRLIRYSYFGTCATLSTMWEMSVTEQTYKAVLAVIADGRTVTEAAKDWWVCPACGVAFTRVGRVDRKALPKNDGKACLHNHYPRGEGLATSPGRRARLHFQSPVLRLRRRRCGLALRPPSLSRLLLRARRPP